jgi:hypothetical protein
VNVIAIGDILLVNIVGLDSFLAFALENLHKSLLELFGEIFHILIGAFRKQLHLSLMRFGHAVTFEAVLITTLLLTHLTIPTQLLQAFRLDLVTNPFQTADFVFGHG